MRLNKLLLATSIVAITAGGAQAQQVLTFKNTNVNGNCVYNASTDIQNCNSNAPSVTGAPGGVGDGQEVIVELANEGLQAKATGEFEFYVKQSDSNVTGFPTATDLFAKVELLNAELTFGALANDDIVPHGFTSRISGSTLISSDARDAEYLFSFNSQPNTVNNNRVQFRMPIMVDAGNVCKFKNNQEFSVKVDIVKHPNIILGTSTGVIAKCKDGVFANGPFLSDNDGALFAPGDGEPRSDSTVALQDYLGFYPPIFSEATQSWGEHGKWRRPPSSVKTVVGRVQYKLCETAVLALGTGINQNTYLKLEDVTDVNFNVRFGDATRMGDLIAKLIDGTTEATDNHDSFCKVIDGRVDPNHDADEDFIKCDNEGLTRDDNDNIVPGSSALATLFDMTPDKIVIKARQQGPLGPMEVKHQELNVDFAEAKFHNSLIFPNREINEDLCGVGPLDKLDREGRQFGFYDWNAVDRFNMNVYRVTGLANRDVDVHLSYKNVRMPAGATVPGTVNKPGFDKVAGEGKFRITADMIENGNAMIMVPGDLVDSVLPDGYEVADLQFRFKDTSPHIDVDRLQFNKGGGQLNTYGDGANNALQSYVDDHKMYSGPTELWGFVADGSGWWDQGNQPTNDGDQELGTE